MSHVLKLLRPFNTFKISSLEYNGDLHKNAILYYVLRSGSLSPSLFLPSCDNSWLLLFHFDFNSCIVCKSNSSNRGCERHHTPDSRSWKSTKSFYQFSFKENCHQLWWIRSAQWSNQSDFLLTCFDGKSAVSFEGKISRNHASWFFAVKYYLHGKFWKCYKG